LRKVLATAAGVALLCSAVSTTDGSTAPPPNPIVRENARLGSPDWQRARGGDIEVYGT
jgi:hypothetical protein